MRVGRYVFTAGFQGEEDAECRARGAYGVCEGCRARVTCEARKACRACKAC